MSGQQHLTSGVALAALSTTMYIDVITTWTDETTVDLIMSVKEFVLPSNILLIPICFVFFLLGLLLPDCDNRNSLIGRYIHVPIEHRTWIHTAWFIFLFIILGFVFKPFFSLAIGYYFHLLCDAPSRCGVCWFVPNYKRYGYAKVKKGHFIYLYDSEPVAWILCGIIITLVIIYILGVIGIISPLRNWITLVDNKVESIVSFVVHLFV